MIKITEALLTIIQENPFLEFGFNHELFNQAQLARYLNPLVKARAQKEVSDSAVMMALSRLKGELAGSQINSRQYVIDKLTVISGLSTASFLRTPQTHRKLSLLYGFIQSRNGFCNLCEGIGEITVIVESVYQTKLKKITTQKPLYAHDQVASICVKFGDKYATIPGMLYMILQRVALQNINLIEISSTYSEINLYFAEKDTRIVFDTLFSCFISKDRM